MTTWTTSNKERRGFSAQGFTYQTQGKGKDDPSLKAKLDKIDAEVKALPGEICKDNKAIYTANLIYSNF